MTELLRWSDGTLSVDPFLAKLLAVAAIIALAWGLAKAAQEWFDT